MDASSTSSDGGSWVPGWYPDPWGTEPAVRWWDGTEWTGHLNMPESPEPAVPAPTAELEPTAAPTPDSIPQASQPPPISVEPKRPVVAKPAYPELTEPVFQPTPDMLVMPAPQRSRRSHSGILFALAAAVLAGLILFGSTYAIRGIAGRDSGSGQGTAVAQGQNFTNPAAADTTAMSTARTAQIAMQAYAVDHDGSSLGATAAALAAIQPTLAGAPLTVNGTDTGYVISVTSTAGNVFTITNSNGVTADSCTTPGTGECPASGVWG